MDDDAITFNSLGLEGSPERPQFVVHAPDATQEDTIIARTVAVAEQWRSRATRRLTPKRPLHNWAITVIIAVL